MVSEASGLPVDVWLVAGGRPGGWPFAGPLPGGGVHGKPQTQGAEAG